MIKGLVEFILVAFPKVLAGAGTLALNVVLLNCLGPEPFAMYSLCIAGIMLADAVIGSALDLGVLRLAPLYRRDDPAHARRIERAALGVKFLLAAACALALAGAARPVSRLLFHGEGQGHLIALGCAAALAMLLLRSTLVHLQVEGRFALYGGLDLAQQGLKFGGIALLLALAPGSASPGRVLVFFALAPALVFALAAPLLRPLWRARGAWRPAAAELLGFARWFLLTFSVTALVSRLDVFLLTLLASLHEVGIFSAAFVFCLVPELLGSYAAIVLSPRIMPAVRAGRFGSFFRRFQAACALGALAAFLAVLAGRGLIERHLLPGAFARSTAVILVLLPGALATMASFPLTIPFLMFARPAFLLKLECVLLPALLLGYVLAIRAHGALGAAWVTSGSRVLKAALSQGWAWRLASAAPAGPAPGGRELTPEHEALLG